MEQVGGPLGHPATAATRTDRPRFARKRDQPVEAAIARHGACAASTTFAGRVASRGNVTALPHSIRTGRVDRFSALRVPTPKRSETQMVLS